MKLCQIIFVTSFCFSALSAEDYLIAHAPQNQQWTSRIYFRTLLPQTSLTVSGYVVEGGSGNGPATHAWTADPYLVSAANSLVVPATFSQIIAGRTYDFLLIQTDAPLGEGKVNFSEANMAHSTRVKSLAEYTASANFNNITVDAEEFAGLAFVVANPVEEMLTLRYRLNDAAGNILAERTAEVVAAFSKVLGQAGSLFPDTAIPPNARINVAVDGSGKIVNGILLQGKDLTMYGGEAESVIADITWTKDVMRIVQDHCQNCHHDGGSAPFGLTRYAAAKLYSHKMEHELEEGKMPPWKPTPGCGEFMNDNSLLARDKETLLAWVRDGAPEGDSGLAAEESVFTDGTWQLGPPDLIFEYDDPVLYEPGPDRLVCLPIVLDNPDPIYLSALELKPGRLDVVHHVVLYSSTSNGGTLRDEAEPGPGYTCFGSSGVDDETLIGAWAPGSAPLPFPQEVGVVLKPNTTLIIQVHYSSELGIDGPTEDQTSVGLFIEAQAPQKELQFVFLGDDDWTIPANDPEYHTDAFFNFAVPFDLYMVFPHMHLLGQKISLGFTPPGGTYQCVIDIQDWEFEWQGFYNLVEPITIPANSLINMHGVYDNSSDNPLNPNDPPRSVNWGDTTGDEMFLHVIGFTAPIQFDKKIKPK